MKKLILTCSLSLFVQFTFAQSEAVFDVNGDAFNLMATRGPSEFMDQFTHVPFERYGMPTSALYVKGVHPTMCPKICSTIGGYMAEEVEVDQVKEAFFSSKSEGSEQDAMHDPNAQVVPPLGCMCLIPRTSE